MARNASRELAAAEEQRSEHEAFARAPGVCFGIGGAGVFRSPGTTPSSSRVCIRSACAGERTSRSEIVVYARMATRPPICIGHMAPQVQILPAHQVLDCFRGVVN